MAKRERTDNKNKKEEEQRERAEEFATFIGLVQPDFHVANFQMGQRTAVLLATAPAKLGSDTRTPLQRLDDRITELEQRVVHLKQVRETVASGKELKDVVFCVACNGEGFTDQMCCDCT